MKLLTFVYDLFRDREYERLSNAYIELLEENKRLQREVGDLNDLNFVLNDMIDQRDW